MRVFVGGCVAIAAVVVAIAATASPANKEEGAAACYARLKTLAGDWYMTDTQSGKEIHALRLRVTSGGNAIEETEFPGSGHEMVTIYHMDGDNLVLTHYCHLGNQPRMKATAASTPSKIVFECAGVGNSKSHNDAHMHAATITPKYADHLEAAWQLLEEGKPGMVDKFSVHRKGAK